MDLSSNQITEMEGLSELTSIREIILTHNQITDIKGLKNLHGLTTLGLMYNKIPLGKNRIYLIEEDLGKFIYF